MKLRRSSYLLICLIALLSLLPGLSVEAQKRKGKEQAAKATPETSSSVPKIEFEKYTLPNGLQVILHVDRKLPIVHVNEWFHVGSKNEKQGRTGFAHLFEHMMFQGSKNASGEYFSYVEKAGANVREGGVNGTTDNDRTNYFVTAPSGNLEYLLWLESDRLATLIDGVDQAKLDNQRDVVKNERRQGLENVPYGRWLSLLVENLHPAGHPYSWPVIGSHEDLTAASLDDVKDFFRRFYTPNNLSLVIAGDFDPAEAKRLVEKYFGPIPTGPALDRPSRWVPKLEGERIVEVSDRVPQERTYMVWTAPPYFDAGDAELTLTSTILTDGLSARLNKVLVYDKQLCTNVNSFPFSSEISGAFVVIATARPGIALPQIEQIITEELGKLAKTGPTAEELDRAKTKQEYQFVTGLERIGGFGGKADLLNQYNTYLGDPNKFEEDINRYRRISANDLKDTVGKWLDTRNRILLRFHPEKSGRPSQVALDRTQQPQLGTDKPFHAPDVKTAKLENGLEIYVVERPELPKASVLLATRAGAVADPAGKEGVAQMTITNIDLGTKTKKALEIGDEFGNLGTDLTGFATREYSALTFEVLKRNLAPALTILSDVVLNSSFPESELEREKKRALDRLAQDAKNPNALAGRIGAMLAFGPNHPYGRPARGLPSTVAKITREDLVQFHQTYWKPGGSALIFVGDVTLAEATELAKKAFGSWTGGAPPQITIPAPQPLGPGKIYIVDQQDAAQTVVSQILRAPQRKTDDYYALNLADAVWGGGGFGTRLNLNLREDKGYSYGVFSNLNLLSSSGVWAAQGGVQTNKTKESVQEFLNELKFIAGQKPVSEKELESAKQTRIRGYSQQFESLGRISGQIAALWAVGLPMSEMQRESEEISRTSLSAVNSAAQKYAVPEQSTLLLVGDLSKIEAGIKDLHSGEVVVLDSEGKPVTK
jgi:zinc protease